MPIAVQWNKNRPRTWQLNCCITLEYIANEQRNTPTRESFKQEQRHTTPAKPPHQIYTCRFGWCFVLGCCWFFCVFYFFIIIVEYVNCKCENQMQLTRTVDSIRQHRDRARSRRVQSETHKKQSIQCEHDFANKTSIGLCKPCVCVCAERAMIRSRLLR